MKLIYFLTQGYSGMRLWLLSFPATIIAEEIKSFISMSSALEVNKIPVFVINFGERHDFEETKPVQYVL
jgi:hypothetical protein